MGLVIKNMDVHIRFNDIQESIPVKDGYYLLVVVNDTLHRTLETYKVVPSELCGGSFYKLEGLAGGVITGMVDIPEIYDKKDILAWARIPEEYYTNWKCYY